MIGGPESSLRQDAVASPSLFSVLLMGLLDFLSGRRSDRRHPEPPLSGGGSMVELEIRAKWPGNLTALDQEVLPDGRLIVSGERPDAGRVAWLSDGSGDQAMLWARLAVQFPQTGLWPIAAETMAGDASRPWESGELAGPVKVRADAGEVLGPRGVEVPRANGRVSRVELRSPAWAPQILLVPSTRPADVTAHVGWTGAVNHDLDGGDVSAVLRSWESRYGAVLTGLGFNTLVLTVAEPPTEPMDVRQVMHEIHAFCPDLVNQGIGDLGGLDPMVRSKEWSFWWD